MFIIVKKIACIVLFIITSVLSSGCFLIYSGYLCHYKSDIRRCIDADRRSINKSVISINPSELYIDSKTISWEDGNKEIVYKEVLYDIVNVKNEKGKVILTVVSDIQEQELKKQISESIDDNLSTPTNNSLKLLKQFLAFKYISDNDLLLLRQNSISEKYRMNYDVKIVPVFINTETLPPNFIS